MSDFHNQQANFGVFIGNQVDKNQLTNPIARRMVEQFDEALFELIKSSEPRTVHEVGCGEGRLSRKLHTFLGRDIRASDFSTELIAENEARGDAGVQYIARSVYELDPEEDTAELIVCCEVLEHVKQPEMALAALRSLDGGRYIFSVPREPLWRALNMARCKYLSAFGNTPGHVNHWSKGGFIRFLERQGFQIEQCLSPIPWTMVAGRRSKGKCIASRLPN